MNGSPPSPNEIVELLRPYEKAARYHMVNHEGLNPDMQLHAMHPQLQGVTVQLPAWVPVASDMQRLDRLLTAMNNTREDNPDGAKLVLS